MADVEAAYAVTTPFQGDAQEELRQGTQIIASATQARLPWRLEGSKRPPTPTEKCYLPAVSSKM
jgi:hypothetical protein